MDVVWFKKDLRVADHRPLQEAAARGPLLCLWIAGPDVIGADDFSASHLAFAAECLADLDRELRRRGGRLVCRTGEAVDVLEAIHRGRRISRLWSHEETGNEATYARDRRVATWCRDRGVVWQEFPQNGVIRRLRCRDGWATRWERRMASPPVPAPEALVDAAPELTSDPLPNPGDFGLGPDTRAKRRQRGGSATASRTLDSFLQARGMHYTKAMSSPVTAFDACSRISPYLTWGCLSVRQAWLAAEKARAALAADSPEAPQATDAAERRAWRSALRSVSSRLRWHCHFMQKLEDEPAIEFQNFSRACDGLRENDWNEERFDRWRTGHTGYPLVDACMRALDATGWINFRMRAMLMSFAAHHLWLHWREPGLHLARLFLDYEPGIHWSQCQMQSGTTTINTLRIYSPSKQLQDHDPHGTFTRQWVPELENVPDNYLAEPWQMPALEQSFAGCEIGTHYPAPIVDHKSALQHARARFTELRAHPAFKAESKRIQTRHGSRRRS